MRYYFHSDNALAWPILHILQAGARILNECRMHIDQGEKEHQSLEQQQKLNGKLHLAAKQTERWVRLELEDFKTQASHLPRH